MGIPQKGSRRFEMDGAKYRYLLKDGKGRIRGQSHPSIRLIVQRNDVRGQILRARFFSKMWTGLEIREGGPDHKVPFTPADIRLVVTAALSQGWQADKVAPALSLPAGVDLPFWESVTP